LLWLLRALKCVCFLFGRSLKLLSQDGSIAARQHVSVSARTVQLSG
jgi:hypothetical protein